MLLSFCQNVAVNKKQLFMDNLPALRKWSQMEKYAHRHNVILGIVKAHKNIMKTRPSNVNCWNINAIAIGPTHVWSVQRCHHHEFIIIFVSSSAAYTFSDLFQRIIFTLYG